MRLMDTVNALSFVPLADLNREGQLRILAIRNQPEIRHNMYTTHEIQEAEHFRWIDRLANDVTTQFFAVVSGDAVIGGISLNAISTTHRRADWAYYIDREQQGRGIGSALEFKFLDYAFGYANILKLNAEVFAFNEKVLSLHKKFGFQQEGARREHIRRDAESLDVILIGITKPEWQAARLGLTEKLFK